MDLFPSCPLIEVVCTDWVLMSRQVSRSVFVIKVGRAPFADLLDPSQLSTTPKGSYLSSSMMPSCFPTSGAESYLWVGMIPRHHNPYHSLQSSHLHWPSL